MPPLFTLKGYTKSDPFDSISSKWKSNLLFILPTLLFFGLFYWLIEEIIPILSFSSQKSKWIFVATFLAIYVFLAKTLRKSSSLFFLAIIGVPLFLLDVYFAGNYPSLAGKNALWSYQSNSFLLSISSEPLRFLLWNLLTALFLGPVVLWLNRLIALPFSAKEIIDPKTTPYEKLFDKKWTENPISKDKKTRKEQRKAWLNREWDFHFLRGVGIVYLFYLLFLWVGWLSYGVAKEGIWSADIQKLFTGTFSNPIHGLNFMGKMIMMSLLGLLAAYNKPLRWYATLALFMGHLISTILISIFYFELFGVEATDERAMLFPAGVIDITLSIFFLIVLFLKKDDRAKEYKFIKGLPSTFSIPYWFSTIFFYVLSGIFLSYLGLLIFARFINSDVLYELFKAEDFIAYNSMTYSGTLALISFMCARSERLKHYLVSTIINPLSFALFAGFIWFVFGPEFEGTYNRYFLLFFVLQAIIITLIHTFRKLRYNIDFKITSLHPSEAMTTEAVVQSLYETPESPVDAKASLKMLDGYISNIRGRKRGLVNFPFWILENVLSPLWGLRPFFSLMSIEERNFFLKKYILRLPTDRKIAFSPPLAEVAFKIGVSIKALATFAHFSTPQGKENAKYKSPENRENFQNTNTYQPNLARLAPLLPERDSYFAIEERFRAEQIKKKQNREIDHLEFGLKSMGILHPKEAYDYIIIGSGAAGGVMAYRLACAVEHPDRILLIERGKRHSATNAMTDNELEMFAKLYKEGGLQQTKNFDMTVLQAECLGGTTVVNNAVCFKPPADVKNRWVQDYGLNLNDLDQELDKIGREINIHTINQAAVNQEVKNCFSKGVKEYNKTKDGQEKLDLIDAVKVNAIDELGDGLWNLGNKRKRKLSMAQTYIKWAEYKGIHILEETNAVRFFSNSVESTTPLKAEEILICTRDKQFKRIKINKKLIIAGGCLASSHFLMRSKIEKNVGQQMSCNYALSFAFKYANKINAFEGAQITAAAIAKRVEKKDLIFETYFNPPAAFAITLPFNFEWNQEIMANYDEYLNFGILVGSENSGRVLPKASILDGRAFEWPLDPKDIEPLKEAFRIIIEIGQLSGAQSVIIPLQPGLRINLENKEEVQKFLELWANYDLSKLDVNLNTSHPQGGNLMAGNQSKHQSERVIDENFKLENHENVFVVDASIFPTSLGVNPQWTVMGMSSLASKGILKED